MVWDSPDKESPVGRPNYSPEWNQTWLTGSLRTTIWLASPTIIDVVGVSEDTGKKN